MNQEIEIRKVVYFAHPLRGATLGPKKPLSEGMRIEETHSRMHGLDIVDRRGELLDGAA